MGKERRRRRSGEARKALTYQLDHVRDEACLDAIVLADDQGLVVAEAGDGALCSSLAAVAPLIARGSQPVWNDLPGQYLQVRVVNWEGSRMYLASCTDSLADTLSARVDGWLEHTRQGVARILAA